MPALTVPPRWSKSTVPLTIISVLSLLLATLLAPRLHPGAVVGSALRPAGLGAAAWFGAQALNPRNYQPQHRRTAQLPGHGTLAPSRSGHLQAAASYGRVLAILALLLGTFQFASSPWDMASGATVITH